MNLVHIKRSTEMNQESVHAAGVFKLLALTVVLEALLILGIGTLAA